MDNKFENLKEELQHLKEKKNTNKRYVFLDYCKKNIDSKEQGKISTEEASYNICGACSMFFNEITPELEKVMDIACDLEIPKEYRDRKDEDWEKLKRIINEA